MIPATHIQVTFPTARPLQGRKEPGPHFSPASRVPPSSERMLLLTPTLEAEVSLPRGSCGTGRGNPRLHRDTRRFTGPNRRDRGVWDTIDERVS